MSNVALAKPSSVTSAIITCTVFGTAGTDFYMKVDRSRFSGRQKIHPTTGDGDAAPSFDLNYFMVTHFSLSGWLVAASVHANVDQFMANMLLSAKNPLSASFKLNIATSLVITVSKVVIPGYDFGYVRDDGVLPTMLDCYATDSHATMDAT